MSYVIDPKTGQPVTPDVAEWKRRIEAEYSAEIDRPVQRSYLRRRARATKPARRVYRKVGRNELCPCGSGKKFKHCHRVALERERQYA